MAGGIAVAFPGSALLAVVLLCPAFGFYAMDTTPGRPVGKIMLLTGSAALFTPLRALWEQGGSISPALDILGDPGVPLLAWLMCGAGWLSCNVLQIGTRLFLGLQTRRRIASLEKERAAIKAEWVFDEGARNA